jgi:hypothetical protein
LADTVIPLGKTYMGTNITAVDAAVLGDIISTEFVYGQINISNDGTMLTLGVGINNVSVANIDRCSGALSNVRIFNKPQVLVGPNSIEKYNYWGYVNGVSISPNNRFLYISTWLFWVWQLDLQDPDSSTAWSLIADSSQISYMQASGYLYLAPNNILYLTCESGGSLAWSAIMNPDEKGAACNLNMRCIMAEDSTLTPATKRSFISPSNVPNYNLAPQPWLCWPNEVEANNTKYTANINIVPNPSRGKFAIKLHQGYTATQSVIVYNMAGAKVYTNAIAKGATEHTIHTTTWPSGIYFVEVAGFKKRVMVE